MEHRKFVLVGPFSPYRGGIAHFSKQLFRGLQRRGHDVEAVTFTRQYPKLFFPGKTQLEEEDQEPGTRLLDTANPFTWSKTGRYVARSSPDTVVFQHWMPFFCPSFASVARRARRGGAYIVCVVHNVVGHEKRWGDRFLTRWLLAEADRVVVMSEAVGDEVRSLGIKADIQRVWHGIYDHFGQGVGRAEARERLSLPADDRLMLFFGFIRKYKGLRVLLESMPGLLRAVPKLRLVIAGEFYDDPAPYLALIHRLGIADHVIVRDSYVPSFKVAAYFSAADVVVQPYLSATQRRRCADRLQLRHACHRNRRRRPGRSRTSRSSGTRRKTGRSARTAGCRREVFHGRHGGAAHRWGTARKTQIRLGPALRCRGIGR